MTTWIMGILIIAFLFAAFWLIRGRNKEDEKQESVSENIASLTPRVQLERIHQSEKFWGAAIDTREDSHACKAARKLVDQPFQTYEAPSLPLKDCDNMSCRCRYYGLPDLRKSERRDTTSDRREQIRYEPSKEHRRSSEDRRKTEELWSDRNTREL